MTAPIQSDGLLNSLEIEIVSFRRLLSVLLRCSVARWSTGIVAATLSIGASFAAEEDRGNIDPNLEIVRIAIGGIDMDIPLGYFYEKTIWAKGKWPKPPKTRTLVHEQIVIDVHLDGMKPWTRETAGDFRGGGLKATRVTIAANFPPLWFENWLRANSRLKETEARFVLPGLKAFRHNNWPPVYYLKDKSVPDSRFYVDCSESPTAVKCNVKFAYRPQLVVGYLIPISDLERWQAIHSGIIDLLDSFQISAAEKSLRD